jgi:hypothetical protein
MSVLSILYNLKIPLDILPQQSKLYQLITFKIYHSNIDHKRVYLKMKSFNRIDLNIKYLPFQIVLLPLSLLFNLVKKLHRVTQRNPQSIAESGSQSSVYLCVPGSNAGGTPWIPLRLVIRSDVPILIQQVYDYVVKKDS